MSIKKTLRFVIIAISIPSTLGGCLSPEEIESDEVGSATEALIGTNGIGSNGIGSNGIGSNGIGSNGIGSNGLNVFTGLGFNGSNFTGMGIPSGSSAQTFGLHDWVNHYDTSADGVSGGNPSHSCGGFETATDSFLSGATIGQSVQKKFQRSGNNTVRFSLSMTTGDTDLYVRKNAPPTLTDYDCRPYAGGVTTENCDVTLNPGDTAFAMVNGYASSGSTGVSLRAFDLNGTGCDDPADKDARLNALSYLINCMCPSSVTVNYSDTHDGSSVTMKGGFNLGPTWCQGSSLSTVSADEESMVSSCLMARINTRGTHLPISLRGYNSSLNPTGGEMNFNATPIGYYWGNIFSRKGCYGNGQAPSANWYECCSGSSSAAGCVETSNWHSTAGSYNQHWEQGNDNTWFFSTERYDCFRGIFPDGNTFVAALGRTCDIDGCGLMKNMGGCSAQNNPNMVGWTASGANNSAWQPFSGDGYQYMSYKGKTWRQANVYVGLTADAENAKLKDAGYTCTNPNGSAGQAPPVSNDCYSFTRRAAGTITAAQDASCGTIDGYSNCIGSGRLINLTNTQAIESIFQVIPNNSGKMFQGGVVNYSEPLSVGIRYSNGSATNAKLRVYTTTNPNSTLWIQKNGNGTGDYFEPTGGADNYKVAYFYPVYQQNYSGITQLKVWLAGETANGADAPHIDAVTAFAGPPPNCTTNCVQ
jgi:hypothetical protein